MRKYHTNKALPKQTHYHPTESITRTLPPISLEGTEAIKTGHMTGWLSSWIPSLHSWQQTLPLISRWCTTWRTKFRSLWRAIQGWMSFCTSLCTHDRLKNCASMSAKEKEKQKQFKRRKRRNPDHSSRLTRCLWWCLWLAQTHHSYKSLRYVLANRLCESWHEIVTSAEKQVPSVQSPCKLANEKDQETSELWLWTGWWSEVIRAGWRRLREGAWRSVHVIALQSYKPSYTHQAHECVSAKRIRKSVEK